MTPISYKEFAEISKNKLDNFFTIKKYDEIDEKLKSWNYEECETLISRQWML